MTEYRRSVDAGEGAVPAPPIALPLSALPILACKHTRHSETSLIYSRPIHCKFLNPFIDLDSP